jgi:hypothetical protein
MKNIKKLLQHALSDKEISDFFDGKVNILKYSELSRYSNINDVLGKYERCIILFENGEIDNGHWTALVKIYLPKRKPYILFADSYGHIMEDEFNWIPKSFQNMSMQKRGILLKLLINQPLDVHYSQYRLQKIGKLDDVNVNTCGRWASMFCLFNMVSEKQFSELFRMGQPYGITPDELVCYIYEDLKNKNK